MFNELTAAGGGGGGDLIQVLSDAFANGMPFFSGQFNQQNWTTDKAYRSIFMIMNGNNQDSYMQCGSRRGGDADAKYVNSISGRISTVYRFDNVESGTYVGTTSYTWVGTILAIE